MDINFILQLPNKKTYELKEVVSTIMWATTLDNAQPGKLKFEIPTPKGFDIPLGATVSFMVDNIKIFYGYVFTANIEYDKISYVCYDSLRYLKNKDAYTFSGKTATQIFVAICEDHKLNHKVVTPCDWEVSKRTYDGKTLFEIITYGYQEALIYTGDWLVIQDNFGVVEQISLKELKTNIVLADSQNIMKYRYQKSIDKDSYNSVLLVQDNSKESVRKKWAGVKQQEQSTWGVLQYYEKVDKDATEQQIEELGKALLSVKNRETKDLRIECVGVPHNLKAGNWVYVELKPLEQAGFKSFQDYIITHCTHQWSNNDHRVKLQLSQLSLGV